MYKLLLLVTVAFADAFAEQPTDIFLLIGQSNMAGHGVVEAQDKRRIPHVFTLTKEKTWVPAIDPIHFDKPSLIGVGLGRSFAATLIQYKAVRSVGLVPAAFGGSALEEWTPGSEHYRNAVARVKVALEGKNARLRGILWHQGEADSTEARSATYAVRFTAFIQQLRADLGTPDCPVLVGQLGEFLKMNLSEKINLQLATLPLSIPHTGFVSSQGLKHKGDEIHFDSPSLREFGRRYALAWLALPSGR
ncbi:sialate O-acetylesterase [Bryobacter aggregatus]|uniref:sialate O-acetylesterase n=1 Tax=Bryobacter aggregatus TaxID=360054 RepID=UPI0004E18D8F|nr:sialate O-acetylesterase [Bryobacter aggregatus]